MIDDGAMPFNTGTHSAAQAALRRRLLAQLLGRCGERLRADLARLLEVTFERLNDALYDLADKVESDRLAANCFDVLQSLRRERGHLRGRFLRTLAEGVQQFPSNRLRGPPVSVVPNPLAASPLASGPGAPEAERAPPTRPRLSFQTDDLTRSGHANLEAALALANMVSKAQARYAEPLQALAHRCAELLGTSDLLRPADLPLAPQAICDAFSGALRVLPRLELPIALIVYKAFDKQVMDHLAGTYAACLELAASLEPPAADDLPVARAPGPPAPGVRNLLNRVVTTDRAVPADRDPDAAAAAPVAAAPPAGGSGMTFEQLRRLLHPGRERAGPAGVPLVATTELLRTLADLQQEAGAADDALLSPEALRHILVEALDLVSTLETTQREQTTRDAATKRRLDSLDADTMDLVFLLFEQILAAPDIPDALKVQVSRLQIPYVKIALLDRGFFADPSHPARQLLNRIAAAAIGWNPSTAQDANLQEVIGHLVGRIVAATETTPQLFATLDREFAAYLQHDSDAARRAELREIKAASARDARRRAERLVRTTIANALQGRDEVPMVVATIIHDGWAEVMLRALLAEGEQGPTWRQGQAVLARLLWSVEPKQDATERRQLLRRIPDLLRELREVLSDEALDQRLLARWLKELQGIHMGALRGAGALAAKRLETPTGSAAASAALPARRGGSSRYRGSVDVDALPLETWVAIARDDGTWLRVKLAWRGSDGDELVLLDRHGRPGLELGRAQLQALFTQGLAQVIGDGRTPLVDRALLALREHLTLH